MSQLGILESRTLSGQRSYCKQRIEVYRIGYEIIGSLHFHAEGIQDVLRKVLDVLGEQHRRQASPSCRDNMDIIEA